MKADEIAAPRCLKQAPNGDVVIAGNSENWGTHGIFLLSYANPGVMPPGELVVAAIDSPWPPVPLEAGAGLEFGTVLAGRRADRFLTVANVGGGVLSDLSFEIIGEHASQFFLPHQPASLLPDGRISPGVAFLPTYLGSPAEGTADYSGPRHATLRIRATGAAIVDVPLAGTAATPRDVFASWAAGGGLLGADAGADAAPHGDGVENLLKFAFNLDPGLPDRGPLAPGGNSGLPAFSRIKVGATEYFQIEYLVRTDDTLEYRLKTSASLAPGSFRDASDWTTQSSAIDATWRRIIRRKAIQPGGPGLFARVEVTLRPDY